MNTSKDQLLDKVKEDTAEFKKRANESRKEMIQKKSISAPPSPATPYKDFAFAARDEILSRVERDYEEFMKTRTFKYPTWLYGPPKGKLFKLEVEDCPRFRHNKKSNGY